MDCSQAFERVVDQEKNRVYSYALYYLANPQEAEDITQEVLLRLWRSWGKLEIESMPRWLTRVTRNACFDVLRKRKVRRAVHTDGDDEESEQIPASDPDASDILQTHEIGQRVQRELAELPEPYRSVLILREIQEYRYDEISAALEIPLNTVKAQIFRGRRLLRERLTSHATHPPLRATGLS